MRHRHRDEPPPGVVPLGFTPRVTPAHIPRDRQLEAQIRNLQEHTEQLRALRMDIAEFARLVDEEPADDPVPVISVAEPTARERRLLTTRPTPPLT